MIHAVTTPDHNTTVRDRDDAVRRLHILVLDDDFQFASAICESFELLGHRAETVTSIADLIGMIACNPIDVVVTDVYMPDGDGVKVALELAAAGFKGLMTAVSGGRDGMLDVVVELAKAHGLSTIKPLRKPLDLDDLKSIVEAAREL